MRGLISFIGYELGSTWHSVSHYVSIGGYVIVVLVVLAIVAYRLREVRKESAARNPILRQDPDARERRLCT
jgi:membrane protein DedA with SNARE-associated domain